jgi:fimbrial chaperone protein
MRNRYSWLCCAIVLLNALALVERANGGTFDVSVSPPRIEQRAKPGKIARNRVTITNFANEPGRYLVKSADWDLTKEGRVTFNEGTPNEGSCRPWVRIERRQLTVPASATRSYRFEVHVPADVESAECRFALLLSADPGTVEPMGLEGIRIPLVGRVAVIVYVTVGKARADLKLRGLEMRERQGKVVPVVILQNSGNAHGRPAGDLTAVDASGRKTILAVEPFPILPGETRAVALQPVDKFNQGGPAPTSELKTPLTIRGKIQWDGGSAKIDQVVR